MLASRDGERKEEAHSAREEAQLMEVPDVKEEEPVTEKDWKGAVDLRQLEEQGLRKKHTNIVAR